jgi:hypothetical protein
MLLIPQPHKIKKADGIFDLSRNDLVIALVNHTDGPHFAAEKLITVLSRMLGKEIPVTETDDGKPGRIILDAGSQESPSEAYKLKINRGQIHLQGESPAGLFHGVQTLLQLIAVLGASVPCCTIADRPDFGQRGFLHDVTRGKVPTLETLKLLVDKLAYYKINQLQLYVEHTFAFSHLPELWRDKDPLTADEIRELDAYCRRNFIELVPCLATFGHLYELMRIQRFEHLGELDIKASQTPHSLWDRMAHYTIDACSEEGFLLVKSMLDEYLPLFSSGRCNICCDETFDLGKGKNHARAEAVGVGRLYIDFVKKLIGVVSGQGKSAMLWGDIVLKHPELIGEVPAGTVFLNWDYTAGVTDAATKTFARAKVRQYVCPGVIGWSRFANDINAATSNIRRMVRYGGRNGAEGVLVTDWGDCGHVNMPANSFHGMVLGAALSWNAGSYRSNGRFDTALSTLEWGERSGAVVGLLRELGSLCFYHFGNMYAWVNGEQCLWDREQDVRDWDCRDLEKKYRRASVIYESVFALRTSGGFSWSEQDYNEFLFSARAVRWSLSLLTYKKRHEYGQEGCPALYSTVRQLINEGKTVLHTFEKLWRGRNKESELRNVTMTFEKMFEKITAIDKRKLGPSS